MYDTVSELYNDLLGIYFNGYNNLIVAKQKIMIIFFVQTYNYDV